MANSKSNQDSKHGGARPGSGRPKGAKTKLKVADFFSPTEVDTLVQQAKDLTILAEKPDKDIWKVIWQDIFGKPTTRIAGDEGEDPLQLIHILKHGSNDKPAS